MNETVTLLPEDAITIPLSLRKFFPQSPVSIKTIARDNQAPAFVQTINFQSTLDFDRAQNAVDNSRSAGEKLRSHFIDAHQTTLDRPYTAQEIMESQKRLTGLIEQVQNTSDPENAMLWISSSKPLDMQILRAAIKAGIYPAHEEFSIFGYEI